MRRALTSLAAVVAIVTLVSVNVTVATSASAQAGPQAPPTAEGGTQASGGRGGPQSSAVLVAYDDYTGFTKLWDGQTLTNWDGETDVWSIKDGAIHADTTKTPGQHHIHYMGPGAVMRDFDLKVEVKLSATGANGGIQYRSRLLHAARGGSIADPLGKPLPPRVTTLEQAVQAGITASPGARGGRAGGASGRAGGGRGGAPSGCAGQLGNPNAPQPAARGSAGAAAGATPTGNPWQVSGYQFDLNSENTYTGQLYEGQGRGIVNPPGGMVLLLPGNCAARIGTVTANLTAAIKPHRGVDGDWQQVQIIARGHSLVHVINGQIIAVTIDDHPAARASQGVLSLQLEGSGQIWYRNIYVKPL